MAQQYGWDDNKKLAKLVEAIEGKALSYYGALDELIRQNYQQVSLKFNTRFYPQEPTRTARNQLAVLTQKPEEELEEFAERALRLAMDAWSSVSIETANQVAQEAFLHGVQDKDAALITMNQSPENLDSTLAILKRVIHDKQSLSGRGKIPSAKVARNVSFYEEENDPPAARSASVTNSSSGGSTTSTTAPRLEQEVKELTSSVTQLIALLKERHKPDAPQSPQSPHAPGSPILCYKCGGRGHRWNECPTKSPSTSTSSATNQSPKPLNTTGLS